MNRLKAWLGDFPTTAGRIVTGINLCIATAFVVLFCFLVGRPIDESNLNSWLIFLGAVLGLDSAQFLAKRVTAWKPPVTTESEAPAPGKAPAEVAPVVGPLDGPTPPIGFGGA